MQSVFTELKRRHVYRTAAFYAAAGWLLVQVATQVAPYFNLPNWAVRLIIVAVVGGFPIVIMLSWYYEWSPSGGLRRENDTDGDRDAAIAPAAAPSRDAATPVTSDMSIAVLSFVDMSQARDQEYFSDGLAEEVMNLLAQLPQLRVIARTSSFSFKGKGTDVATIGRTLGAAHVLEGSVRKAGDRLRVTAQLIRTGDSSHLWSQTFERELTDIFQVQDEIAGAVVAALKVKLLPEQQLRNLHRTDNTEAYDAYLLGQTVLRAGRYDDSQQALMAFERSIALDRNYAAGYAGLASAQSAVADYEKNAERRSALKLEALITAESAIELEPELADGYVVRGQLRYRQLWDWQGAQTDLQRALALEPNSTDVLLQNALLLHNLNHMVEAIALVGRVTATDPLSWMAWLMLGATLRNSGRMAEGRVALKRSLELNPQASWTRHVLGVLELLEGQPELALATFQQAGAPYRQCGVAMAEYTLGHPHESAQALAEAEPYAVGFSIQIAEAHAWRGERDAAFEYLERAATLRDSGIARMRSDPMLRTLHDDPRWATLLKKLNFPA